ncbi:MAG: hypothetical protein P1U49_11770 [Minwuia sp.]|nr:hypothetical protein [Minwuia sp.]
MVRESDSRTQQDAQAPDDDPEVPEPVPQWVPDPQVGLVSIMDPVERRVMGNNTLFLSLYLILFAFFIVLNARAEISTARTEAVLAGLGLPVQPRPAVVQRPMVLVADELEQRLSDVFPRELAPDLSIVAASDGDLVVSLPLRRVFQNDTAVLRTQRLSVMRRMAEVLAGFGRTDGLSLTLVVPPGDSSDLAIRRAAALGRDLVRAGVDASAFAVRIEDQGAASDLRLVLTRNREGAT